MNGPLGEPFAHADGKTAVTPLRGNLEFLVELVSRFWEWPMSVKELEERVLALEQEVQRLRAEANQRQTERTKDWRRAVENYTGDEDVLSVLRDAMELREQSR